MENYQSYLIGFLLTALLIYFLGEKAVNIGLVDVPNERKHHSGAKPLVGGIAIFFGFMFSLLTLHDSLNNLRAFLGASVLVVLVGVLDDLRELSSRAKFGAQIIAGLFMSVWGGVVLRDLGALTFDETLFVLGAVAVPFTIFSVVGVINSINMSDGLDGLSGSLSFIAIVGLMVVTNSANRMAEFHMLFLLAATVAAFLGFNFRFPWRRNVRVFLGDAGSMFLGLALAWFFIKLSQGHDRVMSPVTALWFLLLPLFDTVATMLRRLLNGRPPFAADREHLHHALLMAGYSVPQAVLIMAGIASVAMLIGLLGHFLGIPEVTMFVLFVGLFVFYFWATLRAWKVMRVLNRPMCRRRGPVERRLVNGRRLTAWRRDGGVEVARWIGVERRDGGDRRSRSGRRLKGDRRDVNVPGINVNGQPREEQGSEVYRVSER